MNARFDKTATSSFLSKSIKHLFTGLFFTGIILTVFEIGIFRKTVIDWKIPTAFYLGCGILSRVWLKSYLSALYDTRTLFMQLTFCICSIGGIVSYTFMAANYYIPVSASEMVFKVPIVRTGHLATGKRSSCGQPYAHVVIKGQEKELIFYCDTEIERYRYIIIKLKRGFLGFDRIIEQVPVGR